MVYFPKGGGKGRTCVFTARVTPDALSKLEAYQLRLSRKLGKPVCRSDALDSVIQRLGSEHYDPDDYASIREHQAAVEQKVGPVELDELEAEMLWAVQRYEDARGTGPELRAILAKQSEPYTASKREHDAAREARDAAVVRLQKRAVLRLKGRRVFVTKLGQGMLTKLGWK